MAQMTLGSRAVTDERQGKRSLLKLPMAPRGREAKNKHQPPMPPKMDAWAVKQERQQLLNRRRIKVIMNPLSSPLPCNHCHHDCISMQKAYGHSCCRVFHFAYWIPLGQDDQGGPCLSADTCCYSDAHVRRTRVVPTPAELFKEHIILYHFLFSL
jgi:hypothetical protein